MARLRAYSALRCAPSSSTEYAVPSDVRDIVSIRLTPVNDTSRGCVDSGGAGIIRTSLPVLATVTLRLEFLAIPGDECQD